MKEGGSGDLLPLGVAQGAAKGGRPGSLLLPLYEGLVSIDVLAAVVDHLRAGRGDADGPRGRGQEDSMAIPGLIAPNQYIGSAGTQCVLKVNKSTLQRSLGAKGKMTSAKTHVIVRTSMCSQIRNLAN